MPAYDDRMDKAEWENIAPADAVEIRLRTAEPVHEGESASDVIAADGFHHTTTNK